MARVVVIANQKGGVGKTTTVVNLGAYLAERARVLLLDLDPQANTTSSLGRARREGPSTYDALIGRVPLREVVVPTDVPGLDLAPSHPSLAGAQVELVDVDKRDTLLRDALKDVLSTYQVVLIDSPPSLGILTLNALAAAHAVLVPVQCEYLALEGLSQLVETMRLVRTQINPRLTLLGMLLTMHDARTNLSNQVIAEVRAHFPDVALQTVIPRSVRLSEAPSHGLSVRSYAPQSTGALAYAELAQELVGRGLLA